MRRGHHGVIERSALKKEYNRKIRVLGLYAIPVGYGKFLMHVDVGNYKGLATVKELGYFRLRRHRKIPIQMFWRHFRNRYINCHKCTDKEGDI